MKSFKLKGLDIYIINVESIEVAAIKCIVNQIGVKSNDIEEIPFNITTDVISKLIRTKDEFIELLKQSFCLVPPQSNRTLFELEEDIAAWKRDNDEFDFAFTCETVQCLIDTIIKLQLEQLKL